MAGLKDKTILLIISGGIAAYKSLELIRLLKKDGAQVRTILTKGGSQFITPLSVSSLSAEKTYTDLWSLTDETDMGHIRLSREADLIVVAPASADLMAKMAHGLANDLASTTLLASDKPIMVAPAMNPQMWNNAATQTNISVLKERGIQQIGPEPGDMACGETGWGRMSEPEDIFKAIHSFFFEKPLKGYSALVTSGPTFEKVDPVRFIGNRSSGKQGHAIAEALTKAGASVTLVSGPVNIPAPQGVKTIAVESALEMLEACESALPVDIAVCAAAVSDWRPENPQDTKIKKGKGTDLANVSFTENPDILKTLSNHKEHRPQVVVGFSAETDHLEKNAAAKLERKGCDLLVANLVGPDQSGNEKTFGSDHNEVFLFGKNTVEKWPRRSKTEIASKLVEYIATYLEDHGQRDQKHQS